VPPVTGTAHKKSTSLQEKAPKPVLKQNSGSYQISGQEKLPDLKNILPGMENLENNGIIETGIYMLGGIGTGIIFLFAYSRKM